MFGDKLKELRGEKNLSGPEMAELLELPYTSYTKYERNERFPGPDKLVEIANRLNTSIDYLLGNSKYRERMEDHIAGTEHMSIEEAMTLVVHELITLPDKLYEKKVQLRDFEKELEQLDSMLTIADADDISKIEKKLEDIKDKQELLKLDIDRLNAKYDTFKTILKKGSKDGLELTLTPKSAQETPSDTQ